MNNTANFFIGYLFKNATEFLNFLIMLTIHGHDYIIRTGARLAFYSGFWSTYLFKYHDLAYKYNMVCCNKVLSTIYSVYCSVGIFSILCPFINF